jgi:serine/threonine protein kinase
MSESLSPEFPCPVDFGPELLCPDDSALWPAVMGDSHMPATSQHVAGCVTCQRRVASLRKEVAAIQGVTSGESLPNTPPSPPEPLPERIGEYTILARLGSGGQADVYRAWHPRLKTDVVIKWFRRDAFPDARSNEIAIAAQTLSTIRHPYLAQVFDVGVEQGRHFIMMEYVSGLTFSAWIRRFQPTVPRIAAVLAKAARAVDAVHKQGALHLDLKPGNIIVDEDGNPRVIDFGMARISGSSSQRSLLLSPGTPEFMSPEQCVGDASRIAVESDVYGLGAVLFSALCQQPIRSEEQMAIEPNWRLIRHASWGLRRICHRALATCPQDRYESAATLAKELERFAEQRSILRRCGSVAMVLAGITSCYWGITSPSEDIPLATLEIHSHSQYELEQITVFETRCSAVLDQQRQPCLVIATATTNPVTASVLVQHSDAEWRIAEFADEESSIQVDDTAGPHLILTCAEREWDQAPAGLLNEWMSQLQSLPVRHTIEILIDQRQISLRPVVSRELSLPEIAERESALATVHAMQSALDLFLPSYSGIVVIPPRSQWLAALP